MTKKREILPALNRCITTLAKLTHDAAILELNDNETASRKLKRDLANFKGIELAEFTEVVHKTREDVKLRDKRKYNGNPLLNLTNKKQKQ